MQLHVNEKKKKKLVKKYGTKWEIMVTISKDFLKQRD